jgi:YVTN family beta-propeller protein
VVLFAALVALALSPVQIPVALHPCGAAAGFGSVWVASDSGTVSRIDPRTDEVRARVPAGRGACSVTTGAGAVWVTNYRSGSVLRIDPVTLQRRSVRVGKTPFDVLVANGRVWATAWNDGKLVEIHPRTLRVLSRIDVGPYPTGLHAQGGAIWIGFGRGATSIVRFEPRTRSLGRIEIGARNPSWFADGTRDLWIQTDDNLLVHVDPTRRRVVGSRRIGRTLAQAAAAADGTIWVPDKEQDLVFRVDPGTGHVLDSFRGGDGAFAALNAFGSMWVTSYAGDDVWRWR